VEVVIAGVLLELVQVVAAQFHSQTERTLSKVSRCLGGWSVGNHRLVLGLLNPLLLLAAASGCQMLHPQAPPVDVRVRDAESKSPIAGAEVRVWHSGDHSVVTHGTTGADGLVQVPAPPAEDKTPLLYDATAQGYLIRQTERPSEITPTGVVLELYVGPRPTVELVVPDGYKGVLKLTIRVQDDLRYPPGQRLFTYGVPASGVAAITLPPIFNRDHTPDIRARYASGNPIPRDAKDYEIGCRWLKADPEKEYVMVIGTQWEADQTRRDMKKASGGRDQIGEESITGYGRFR
jgi:hypothetical protein